MKLEYLADDYVGLLTDEQYSSLTNAVSSGDKGRIRSVLKRVRKQITDYAQLFSDDVDDVLEELNQ